MGGFRGYSVGTDTLGYKEGVEYYFTYGTQMWNHGFSDGYGWFSRAILTIYNNYTFLLVIEAIIICGLFAWRLWDYRNTCSLGFAMFVYAATEYPLSLCLTCQCISISIVFFAGRYLDRDKPVCFLVLLIIASMIHVSALIGLVFLMLYVYRLENKTKGILYAKLLAGIALFAGGIIAGVMLFYRYGRYAINESSIGLMVFVQVSVLVLSLFAVGYFSERKLRERIRKELDLALPLYMVGIVLSASSYIIANAGRIAYYFSIYAPIVFGHFVKDSNKNKVAFALSLFLGVWFLFYAWYAYLFNTGLGIESYSFVWMEL